MKVLIAEDERVARRILETVLLKQGYEVVLTDDGASALKQALTFTQPYIAILDWVMPGLSGPQVCLCLRSPKLKIRPYIMVLSARSDKGDIAVALDAGADDFISKPFNQTELIARLRVAERTLRYQDELRLQIGQLEALANRYNLLGEIVAQQSENRLTGSTPPALATGGGQEAEAAVKAGAANFKGGRAQSAFIHLSAAEADVIMKRVITEMGIGHVDAVPAAPSETYTVSEFTAWAGMILERDQVWIDLLFEVNSAAMMLFFEKTLGRRPTSEQQMEHFLAETQTIISAGFKSALLGKGIKVLAPFLSRVVITKGHEVPVPARREAHRYSVAGQSVGLSIVQTPCPLTMKQTNNLRTSDIMAAAYPPPDEVHEMPLLAKGTILTQRFIEKLVTLEEEEQNRLSVPVFSVSTLADYFMAKR